MNVFTALLKREFWENRGAIFTTPLVISAVLLAVTLLGLLAAYQLFQGTRVVTPDIQLRGVGDLVQYFTQTDPLERKQALTAIMYGLTMPFNLVLFFVVLFYFLGALYDERKERSILFWKSLPVSDTQTVLSKLVTGALIAPALAIGAMMITHILWLAIMTLVAWSGGASAWSTLWGPAAPWQAWGILISAYAVQALWSAPFFGWLLLASAYAKRAPFLYATVPVLLVMFLEGYFNHTARFAHIVAERSLGGVVPRSFSENSIQVGIMVFDENAPSPVITMDSVKDVLFSTDMVFGLAVAVVFIGTAIYIRRYRDET